MASSSKARVQENRYEDRTDIWSAATWRRFSLPIGLLCRRLKRRQAALQIPSSRLFQSEHHEFASLAILFWLNRIKICDGYDRYDLDYCFGQSPLYPRGSTKTKVTVKCSIEMHRQTASAGAQCRNLLLLTLPSSHPSRTARRKCVLPSLAFPRSVCFG